MDSCYIVVLPCRLMVWRRTIVDLSKKDVAQSERFVELVQAFKIEHLASTLVYTVPSSSGIIKSRDLTLDQFFSHTDSTHMVLDFGSPIENINIFSTFSRHPANFYLYELLSMDHEMGVLDAYACAYGEPLLGYVPQGKV